MGKSVVVVDGCCRPNNLALTVVCQPIRVPPNTAVAVLVIAGQWHWVRKATSLAQLRADTRLFMLQAPRQAPAESG